MAVKTRYYATKESENGFDNFGNTYPDILSFPIQKFIYNEVPTAYYLTEADILRFDALIYKFYGSSDYDDIILYLNQFKNKHDLAVGDKLLFPTLKDLTLFYNQYVQ